MTTIFIKGASITSKAQIFQGTSPLFFASRYFSLAFLIYVRQAGEVATKVIQETAP
jgi:hypothetical protein